MVIDKSKLPLHYNRKTVWGGKRRTVTKQVLHKGYWNTVDALADFLRHRGTLKTLTVHPATGEYSRGKGYKTVALFRMSNGQDFFVLSHEGALKAIDEEFKGTFKRALSPEELKKTKPRGQKKIVKAAPFKNANT